MTHLWDCVIAWFSALVAGDCILSYLVHAFLFPVEKIASKLEKIQSSTLDAPGTRLADAG